MYINISTVPNTYTRLYAIDWKKNNVTKLDIESEYNFTDQMHVSHVFASRIVNCNFSRRMSCSCRSNVFSSRTARNKRRERKYHRCKYCIENEFSLNNNIVKSRRFWIRILFLWIHKFTYERERERERERDALNRKNSKGKQTCERNDKIVYFNFV